MPNKDSSTPNTKEITLAKIGPCLDNFIEDSSVKNLTSLSKIIDSASPLVGKYFSFEKVGSYSSPHWKYSHEKDEGIRYTFLGMALFLSKNRSEDFWKFLKEKGLNLSSDIAISINGTEATPNIAAILLNDKEVLRDLKQQSVDIYANTIQSLPPIFMAIKSGGLDMIEFLIENSIDINEEKITDSKGLMMSLLQFAIENSEEVAHHLIKNSSRLGINLNAIAMESPDKKEGSTALNIAIARLDSELVKLLFRNGVRLTVNNNWHQDQAVEFSIIMSEKYQKFVFQIISDLKKEGIEIDLDCHALEETLEKTNKQKKRSLAIVTLHRKFDLIPLLIKNGANPNKKVFIDPKSDSRTLLGFAMKLILECGGGKEKEEYKKFTKSLIVNHKKLGIDLNIIALEKHDGSRKVSALGIAIDLGYVDLVELLIKNGANPQELNQELDGSKFSAIGLAIAHERFEEFELLTKNLDRSKLLGITVKTDLQGKEVNLETLSKENNFKNFKILKKLQKERKTEEKRKKAEEDKVTQSKILEGKKKEIEEKASKLIKLEEQLTTRKSEELDQLIKNLQQEVKSNQDSEIDLKEKLEKINKRLTEIAVKFQTDNKIGAENIIDNEQLKDAFKAKIEDVQKILEVQCATLEKEIESLQGKIEPLEETRRGIIKKGKDFKGNDATKLTGLQSQKQEKEKELKEKRVFFSKIGISSSTSIKSEEELDKPSQDSTKKKKLPTFEEFKENIQKKGREEQERILGAMHIRIGTIDYNQQVDLARSLEEKIGFLNELLKDKTDLTNSSPKENKEQIPDKASKEVQPTPKANPEKLTNNEFLNSFKEIIAKARDLPKITEEIKRDLKKQAHNSYMPNGNKENLAKYFVKDESLDPKTGNTREIQYNRSILYVFMNWVLGDSKSGPFEGPSHISEITNENLEKVLKVQELTQKNNIKIDDIKLFLIDLNNKGEFKDANDGLKNFLDRTLITYDQYKKIKGSSTVKGDQSYKEAKEAKTINIIIGVLNTLNTNQEDLLENALFSYLSNSKSESDLGNSKDYQALINPDSNLRIQYMKDKILDSGNDNFLEFLTSNNFTKFIKDTKDTNLSTKLSGLLTNISESNKCDVIFHTPKSTPLSSASTTTLYQTSSINTNRST